MSLREFENQLQKHGQRVRDHITPPFDIESEELVNMKKSKKITTSFILVAAIVCILGTSVFAAYQYLNAKQVADTLGDAKLAQAFQDSGAMSEPITDGKYKAAILGIASGKEISDFKSSSWDVFPDRMYVAVAVERSDGSAMTYDDEILVTPLIDGLRPWQYNIVTMNGGYTAQIIDGVLYRIIECDDVALFADRQVYLAVTDMTFCDNRPYKFDEKTGRISQNESYDGTNILFDLKLDKSKANPEKAAKYLLELENSHNADSVPDEASEDSGIIDTKEIIITEEDLKQ